ncbi:hypothetical protein OW763_05195 [Clostridium aestuarii]|uniref:PilN domain-containing protein n=1 Tax=Clostridium aestuarii TaxID=338193 RepID=A0ABT4CXP7_9CLOT|nr:hypothetical protein [Clostridium aestuarii]MCY6483744.1 hypothetical protein [Clostridium aestuarii]
MEDYNFLPLWYRKKKKDRYRLRFKIQVVLFLILIIGFSIRLLVYTKKVNELQNEINLITKQKVLKNNKIEFKEKQKMNTIITLNDFLDNINDKIWFDYVSISDNIIKLENNDVDIEKINDFIKYMEGSKQYKINNLEITEIKENKNKFMICLEVKGNE